MASHNLPAHFTSPLRQTVVASHPRGAPPLANLRQDPFGHLNGSEAGQPFVILQALSEEEHPPSGQMKPAAQPLPTHESSFVAHWPVEQRKGLDLGQPEGAGHERVALETQAPFQHFSKPALQPSADVDAQAAASWLPLMQRPEVTHFVGKAAGQPFEGILHEVALATHSPEAQRKAASGGHDVPLGHLDASVRQVPSGHIFGSGPDESQGGCTGHLASVSTHDPSAQSNGVSASHQAA